MTQQQRIPNRLVLQARIAAKEVLRVTPAGIPVLDLELQHGSVQVEAGGEREVEVSMAAKAAGEIARHIDRLALSTDFRFAGFVARKSSRNRQIVFHITAFENIEPA